MHAASDGQSTLAVEAAIRHARRAAHRATGAFSSADGSDPWFDYLRQSYSSFRFLSIHRDARSGSRAQKRAPALHRFASFSMS